MAKMHRNAKHIPVGLIVIAMVFSFLAGIRLQSLGDWFFAPYSNSVQNAGLQKSLDYDEIKEVYEHLRKRFDGKLDFDDLQAGMSRGLIDAAGDEHSVYLTAEQALEFADDLNGRFSGIGAELSRRNNAVTVVTPISGSPAEKAGLRPGDVIIRINEDDATGMSIDQAVGEIRGKEGTKVKLGILRANKTMEMTITRAQITVPSVTHEILEGNVGYIKIARFGADTADLARDAAVHFKGRGVRKVIIDVRNNGGGLLESPVQIAGLWLDNKVIASQRTGGKVTSELRSGGNPILSGVETIVLINEGSASASEILAGALHDHNAATLLGETSFGKGSVQEIINLRSGAQLKLTTAHWYTPKGKNIDKDGIEPDTRVELTEDDFNNNRDPQRDQALDMFR